MIKTERPSCTHATGVVYRCYADCASSILILFEVPVASSQAYALIRHINPYVQKAQDALEQSEGAFGTPFLFPLGNRALLNGGKWACKVICKVRLQHCAASLPIWIPSVSLQFFTKVTDIWLIAVLY